MTESQQVPEDFPLRVIYKGQRLAGYLKKFNLYEQLSKMDFVEEGLTLSEGGFSPYMDMRLRLQAKPRWLPRRIWRFLLGRVLEIQYYDPSWPPKCVFVFEKD